MSTAAHTVVFSLDEKSQIPGARPHPARPAIEEGPRRNHDPRLQTAWDDDPVRGDEPPRRDVIGRNTQRRHHHEFIRFLNTIEGEVPAGKTAHAILDNCAAHKHPAVREWLARHPRWTFHFTRTSASYSTASKASSAFSPNDS